MNPRDTYKRKLRTTDMQKGTGNQVLCSEGEVPKRNKSDSNPFITVIWFIRSHNVE